MAQIIPPTITPAPTPAPSRGDRATFSGRVDAFVSWLTLAVDEFGSVATNVYSNASDAYSNSVSAAASAASAAATSGVTKWVSGTSYNAGDNVWSPTDFHTYRRKITGAGTTDPISDSTNWVLVISASSLGLVIGTNVAAAGANTDITSLQGVSVGTGGGGLGSNTRYGADALYSNTTGQWLTAVGAGALYSNTTGQWSTAVGVRALYSNTTGANSTAVGVEALYSNTTGSDSTAVGVRALSSNTTGSNSTAVGAGALYTNTTGNLSTAVGFNALYSNTTFSNASGFGSNAEVTGSNQVQLGDSATTTYVYGTVQNRSDLRDKADIQDTNLGLDFIMSLRPVDYRWDMRDDYRPEPPSLPMLQKPTDASDVNYTQLLSDYEDEQAAYKISHGAWLESVNPENITRDGSKKRTRFHHGFIAQDVMALNSEFGGVQDHSIKGGHDVLSLGYDEFIAPLVKAMQELKAEFDAYKLDHP